MLTKRSLPALLLLVACAPDGVPETVAIPADPQRPGDAARGYTALVTEGYVSCGIPYSIFKQYFGDAPPSLRLPGRTGDNEKLPYMLNAFTTKDGVEVVSANCLSCHAATFQGQVVVGMGNTSADFTQDESIAVAAAASLAQGPAEKAEVQKFYDRTAAIAPYIVTRTVGVNPADNTAAVLFSHRDPSTLAWSDTPLLDLPTGDTVPLRVPPWWRMKKKNAMLYTAAGRGDHARIMMAASTLCTDSVADAMAIDAYFADVRAYIESLDAPKWPFPVDADLAAKGQGVFEATCARCHGTYGAHGGYPNLLVTQPSIGTDTTLSSGASDLAGRYVDWWNKSFYGQTSRLAPQDGYVAPPLDGIWAVAPYLHNGSVPTIAALLDSRTRPTYWSRTFDDADYDQAHVGWNISVEDHGPDAEPDAKKRTRIYDTTLPDYGNGGHTYGDALSDDDRKAVLEYLKTL